MGRFGNSPPLLSGTDDWCGFTRSALYLAHLVQKVLCCHQVFWRKQAAISHCALRFSKLDGLLWTDTIKH